MRNPERVLSQTPAFLHLGRGLLPGTRFPDLREHPRCPGSIRGLFDSE